MVKLSLVICTYNRAPHLVRTLESFACQTVSAADFEIVVVDNNSQDDTTRLARDFADRHPKLDVKVIPETRQGLSYARNSGIAASRGAVIVMVDDDEVVNPEFLESYLRFFDRHSGVAAAGGVIVPFYEFEPPQWLSKYTERLLASTLDLGGEVREFPRHRFPVGGNMAFRRDVFEQYGNFDTDLGRKGETLLGGEENDLFRRVRAGGDSIYYLPTAIVYHIIPASRLTGEYLDRLSLMVGVSKKIRARAEGAVAAAIMDEAFKWLATLCLALACTLNGRPQQGVYLVRMRKGITQGLLGKSS